MYWQDHDLFGPSRSMHRPVLRWQRRGWYRKSAPRRKPMPWRRAKWTWWPQHVLNRRVPMKTQIRNDHFMRQLDRCKALLRPPHLRKPVSRQEHRLWSGNR